MCAACSSPPVQPTVEVTYVTPPALLYAPDALPSVPTTVGEVLTTFPLVWGLLKECNADKHAIREWVRDIESSH